MLICAPDLSLEGETLANDYHWRSTKAKKQLRDRFGRWISLGANVRFRGDGVEQSGTVTSVVDGKAYVDQKNRDGTVTQKIVLPGQIRVIASKATLPQDGKKIFDKDNSFEKALKKPEVQKSISEQGQAFIERADGYGLAVKMDDEAQGLDNVIHDGTEVKNKDGGNPIAYQLFAPGGRSLGQYGEAAVSDFDEMVNDDIMSQENAATPSGDTETVPMSPTGEPAAPAAVAASVAVTGEEKPFRVPESVREGIKEALSSYSNLDSVDRAIAEKLANNDTVSFSEVEWIHRYFCVTDTDEKLHGGFKGRKWAAKIVESGDEIIVPDDTEVSTHPKYLFDDETYAYFATGIYAGSTLVNNLLQVNYETGEVAVWTPDGFSVVPDLDMKEVDEPQVIPIDEMTADEFAHWLDSGTAEEFDILDTNPEERNLFNSAQSEIDYDELDEAYSIIAAAGDGIYTPVERSQNAKVQRRGAGGKFGGGGGSQPAAEAVPEAAAPKTKKAVLPVELPLVVDVAARIQEWLSTAAEAPVVAAAEPEYTEEDQAVEDAATGPTDEAIYFAIVDEIDKTAVLDAVSIVKQNGQPSAFIRSGGQWTASPDTLTLLQGNTPPAVVELPDPETVKTVLTQIDAHDAGADQTEVTEAEAPQEGEVPIAASAGFSLADGTYSITKPEDIETAVSFAGEDADIFVKAHVRKRARALNRMDLVPAEWREFSLAEIGELSASQTVYGEFGEIVASGIPGVADTPSDFKNVAKLQAYWTTGKGALKVRWGTKGDLTRAHRHLSKYVGPQRAWGLAQKYHKSLFGVYNHTHDVATGQYVPRRRKK